MNCTFWNAAQASVGQNWGSMATPAQFANFSNPIFTRVISALNSGTGSLWGLMSSYGAPQPSSNLYYYCAYCYTYLLVSYAETWNFNLQANVASR